MKKTKILFLIHDLGHGGAEKVLVNLVNNMDETKFDITVTALFGGGVNEQFLKPHIRYNTIFKKPFRGNIHILKLFSPKFLHKRFVKEKYDIEVSYLEGPSARIISGCNDDKTKKICWIHTQKLDKKSVSASFRGFKEAYKCYNRFDKIACVSSTVKDVYSSIFGTSVPVSVVYNTNESKKIQSLSKEPIESDVLNEGEIKLVGVGSLNNNKGFHRVIPIVKKLNDEGIPLHYYILGEGGDKEKLENQAKSLNAENMVTFLGYQTNPYKYVAKCNLFICSSYIEGFSTAATEALIVSTPVCTTEVSGMKEMLGENNEWGIVTENTDEALYEGIKSLVSNPDLLKHYKEKAEERGKFFTTEATVKATEEFLLG